MRIAPVVFAGIAFAGAIAAVSATITPVLARHSDPQKGEDKPASSCDAYQQAPDGSWIQLSCNESGERDQVQKPHKHAARSAGQETR